MYGESGLGNAAYFLSYGTNASVPTLYAQSNALSNVASFYAANANNSADAVTINRIGAGRSLFVDMASFANPMNFYDVVNTGNKQRGLKVQPDWDYLLMRADHLFIVEPENEWVLAPTGKLIHQVPNTTIGL